MPDAATGSRPQGIAMIALDEARQRILEAVVPTVETEVFPTAEAAGRYLAEAARARVPSPGFDNAAMDGYAVRRADLGPEGGELPVAGTVAAGEGGGGLPSGACLRIWTGAPLPEGADAVVIQEDVAEAGDGVRFGELPPAGSNIRRAAEDVAAEDVLAEAGRRISPELISALITAGVGEVAVRTRPRALVLATGSELVEPGQEPGPGGVYSSNRPAVVALLREAGARVDDGGDIADRPEDLRAALERAADYDLAVTTGGVSAGDLDLVRPMLDELGRIDLWKVALKPGKPFAFGRLGNAHFFGLPGNPVSALVTARQLLLPAVARWQGGSWVPARVPASAAADFQRGRTGRTELVPARLRWREGTFCAWPLERQGSGMIAALSQADGFIVVPADSNGFAAGDPVTVELAGPGASPGEGAE